MFVYFNQGSLAAMLTGERKGERKSEPFHCERDKTLCLQFIRIGNNLLDAYIPDLK